jgi:hypothetical protein
MSQAGAVGRFGLGVGLRFWPAREGRGVGSVPVRQVGDQAFEPGLQAGEAAPDQDEQGGERPVLGGPGREDGAEPGQDDGKAVHWC